MGKATRHAWVGVFTAALLSPGAGRAEVNPCVEPLGICGVQTSTIRTEAAPSDESAGLLFFWGMSCPHCEAARPFVTELAAERPGLGIEAIEVREDDTGRARFMAVMRAIGVSAPGIPAFVYGDRAVIGYQGVPTESRVRAMLDGGRELPGPVHLPIVGAVDALQIPLLTFTLLVGLVDGINPCAMWVLLVLLGILSRVRDRRRVLLFGGTFVLVSGLVYFLFMTVWVGLFSLAGLSRPITVGLGLLVLGMGLVNLKELIWFKKGPSLTIPERAKPGLYKRMRGIANAARLPIAFAGIIALAFLVNLVELGCTLGLPAVYTRVLTLRGELGTLSRFGYLALYNVAYVVPLAAIVFAYALTMKKIALKERGAQALKAVSGVLLVLFGLAFLLWPELLS